MTEEYEIIYRYKRPDGYWVWNAKEIISIPLNPEREKDNHFEAAKQFHDSTDKRDVYVVNVTYC